MTDDEKKEYIDALAAQTKNYCGIDYDDDEDIIKIIIDAVFEELSELIPALLHMQ